MGKTIIQQARGHGSFTYRVRRRAYIYEINYPPLKTVGKLKIDKLINSPCHTAPIIRFIINGKKFYTPAAQDVYEGQEVEFSGNEIKTGNVMELKKLPVETRIFNIEIRPGDGGKIGRTSGTYATVIRTDVDGKIVLLLSSKREVKLNPECRATIGIAAGQGRKLKPVVKAGKKHHMMKARNKLWPRTSAVKMNAVDHPFGCGRGKRIKSKIAKRNAPAGAKVGHLRPSRTGHIR
ncbi:MAG: 50S ribosomal protein L2 [archaeon]|nr:50S ribosomal protein L2 [archaeon]